MPRSAALIVLGALGVHQLRYLLAYGGAGGHELAAQGHDYLAEAVPVLGSFVFAAVLAGLVGACAGGCGEGRRGGFGRRAAAFALAVFTIYAVQELAEGFLASGHAAGLGAIFGAGGWIALPLTVAAGAACAVFDRGLARLEQAVAALAAGSLPTPRPAPSHPAPAVPALVPQSPLAFGLARRPPPAIAR